MLISYLVIENVDLKGICMNRTKKVAVIFVIVIMMFAFVSCAGKAPEALAGTWELVGAKAMGQTLSLADLKAAGADVELSFEFSSANRVKVKGSVSGDTSGGTASYTFEDNIVTVKDATTTITLELVGDQLQMSQSGVLLLFERV